jgi:hypothetical protein
MRRDFGLLAAAIFLGLGGPALAAGDKPDPGTQVTSKRVPTPEEKAEKEARQACKIEICDILATGEEQGPSVACDIGWTWRAEEIVDALGGRIDWPWGKAVCQSKLKLERVPLVKAMSDPNYKLAAEPQTVRCAVHQKGGKPYVITVDLAPRVTFKNGKATEAQVNWGDVSAPAAIYPLLYAATGLDNSTNVLGPEVVRQVNKFARKDCAEVKDELPGRRVN